VFDWLREMLMWMSLDEEWGRGVRDILIRAGIPRADVEATCYANALAAFGRSGQMKEEHWLSSKPRDERLLFQGNSVLRGQQPRVDELPVIPERDEQQVIK
jgi:hypothetical protein